MCIAVLDNQKTDLSDQEKDFLQSHDQIRAIEHSQNEHDRSSRFGRFMSRIIANEYFDHHANCAESTTTLVRKDSAQKPRNSKLRRHLSKVWHFVRRIEPQRN